MRCLNVRYFAAACVIAFAVGGFAQQVADPDLDTRVARPAYTGKHPKVLFDEAHNNFHTASGRYKPFADLITMKFGMNRPGTDNRQLALNILHWLSGVLK